MSSINHLSTDDDSDERSISKNTLEDIWDGSQMHTEINTRDARLKTRYCIQKTKNQWRGAELSAKSMGKVYIKSSRQLLMN